MNLNTIFNAIFFLQNRPPDHAEGGISFGTSGGHGLLERGLVPHSESVDETRLFLSKVVLADVLVAIPTEVPGTPEPSAEADNAFATHLGRLESLQPYF